MENDYILKFLVEYKEKAINQITVLSVSLQELKKNTNLAYSAKNRIDAYTEGIFKQKILLKDLLYSLDSMNVDEFFCIFDKIQSITGFIKNDARSLYLELSGKPSDPEDDIEIN